MWYHETLEMAISPVTLLLNCYCEKLADVKICENTPLLSVGRDKLVGLT